jgi:O-antigen ligase
MLVSSLIPVALAWLQQLTGIGYFFLGFVGTEFAYRPQGTFAHPAALASYLIILLTMAVGIYFSGATTKMRAVLLAWAGVAASCLVLTLARAEWLGMLVAALVVGLLKRRRLALLALLVAVLLLTTVPLLRERLTAAESIGWRLDLWRAAKSLAWPPTLLGRGLATAHWHINQLLPKVDAPPHDDYLKVIIEVGLAGLVAYGIWLLALVRHAWRAYRRAQEPTIAWRALALLAIVLAGTVISVADNYLGYTAVQWYLWALVALVPPGGRWAPVGGVPRHRRSGLPSAQAQGTPQAEG